jgi:serine-type D-Ala-D-Ala carboxypeptidase/endopeptidase (penicillin-binding protein 4)
VGSSRRRVVTLLVCGWFAATATTARAATPDAVRHVLAASRLGAAVSVTVLNAAGGVVFDSAGATPRIPASNEKLVASIAALETLGPAWRATTRVMATSAPVAGVVTGDLYLVGGGDWTLSTARHARVVKIPGLVTLLQLARAVRAAGVREVTGAVAADGSWFDEVRGGAGWRRGFLGPECAPLSALSVDANRTSKGAAVWQPELNAATLFASTLRSVGVRVDRPARVASTPQTAVTLATRLSPPLALLLAAMDKNSDNFAAEMLLKQVGVAPHEPGTSLRGAAAARALLAGLGVPLRGVRIVDGSGLSLDNRLTTRAVAAMLAVARRSPVIGPVLRNALSIAGVDGTLRYRMTTGPARGVVRAKTGTLDGVSALSGYVHGLVFSVIINARRLSQTRAHLVEDGIAETLAAAAAVTSRWPADARVLARQGS